MKGCFHGKARFQTFQDFSLNTCPQKHLSEGKGITLLQFPHLFRNCYLCMHSDAQKPASHMPDPIHPARNLSQTLGI